MIKLPYILFLLYKSSATSENTTQLKYEHIVSGHALADVLSLIKMCYDVLMLK